MSNRTKYQPIEWTPEMDAKVLAAKHGELSTIALELEISTVSVSKRRTALGAAPMHKRVSRRAYVYESRKKPVADMKKSTVGLPFARPSWFNEDVVSLARRNPPYAVTCQGSRPRLGDYRVLSK